MSSIDPDEAPTQSGDSQRGGRGPEQSPDEDRTVPSLQAAAVDKPKPAAGGGSKDTLIGKTVGGCRMESLLGRGAMGAVYKARQVSLDRDVAVKVIRPEMMTDPRMLKRFEVEARTVGKFNSAHVVMVHDVGFEFGVHFLVMEFVQGKNMREHSKLLAGGRLPAGEAIPLLRQACKGLEEAQRLGVIHRDIKPDNLMLTDRGVLKIADFGIAKPIHEDFNMTMTSELIGTPLYMSPEQCQGSGDLDFRSDMYSLGATFYYLLTGEPPIRASSVYELIQTKTKLENLCLWKALPDLDQNHPLSRVIERMTSLDRDDRYESYEALLNDIVLVEQGGTVNIPAKGSGKSVAARAKAAKKKRRNVLVGALVLVVAAGGYALATSGGGGGGGGPNSVPDAGKITAQLLGYRTRLANKGPDASLRKDVEAVQVEPSTKANREELLEDVDRGMAASARLERLKRPDSLSVPFDDLKTYFADVERAVGVEGTAGKDLQTWLNKARLGARSEKELGAIAVTSLTVAFRDWQADRNKGSRDEAKRLELGKRLDVIEAGRRTLLVQIPTQEAPLERALPVRTLDLARQGLTDNSVQPPGDVDESEVLKEIQDKFESEGPDAALGERTKKVMPTRDDQKATKDKLLIALERASGVATLLEGIRTQTNLKEPSLPFTDVQGYYEKIERALDPVRTGDVLPQWAGKLRTKLRDEKNLQALVLATCQGAFARWTKQSAEGAGGGVDQLEADLQQLKLGIANAGKLFPEAKVELEKLIPAKALADAQASLELGKKKQLWLGKAGKMQAQLEGLRALTEWRPVAASNATDFEGLRVGAADFASDTAVQRELNRLSQLRERWTEADKRVTDLVALIVAGDLTATEPLERTGVPGAEGKEEFKQLSDAASKCRSAFFEALDKNLAIDQAATLLGEARSLIKSNLSLAAAADAHVKEWIEKLDGLKGSSAGMVAIPEGRTTASPTRVQSFFLSATECSYGDFNKFLGELRKAATGSNSAARLQAVASRLQGTEITADQLQTVLDMSLRKQPDKQPVERVNFHAATAFAAWNRLVLPTVAEWSLAAFGDGNRVPYPWGPDWSTDPKQRNTNNKLLAEVDADGLSWRLSEGKRLHHLGGNVAEWLATEPGASSAPLAGGRYTDSDAKAREQAGGQMLTMDKTESLIGFGFRTALRPRAFLGSLWPR